MVLLIVGLIASLAGLSVTSGGRPYIIEGSVRVFADVAEYAMDEAQLAGIDMGLLLRQRRADAEDIYSYQWLQLQPAGWEAPLLYQEVFEARDFPNGIELQLAVEDGAVEFETDITEDDEENSLPQVIFYSSGETTPGSLTLLDASDGSIMWRLEWVFLGRMTLKRNGLDDDET